MLISVRETPKWEFLFFYLATNSIEGDEQMIVYANTGNFIHIGRAGEHLATQVIFDISEYKKECEEGLTRMVAGYSWEWVSNNDPTRYDIEIEGVKRKWNHCTEGWVHSPEAIDEIGCIHSIQGYDLNYAFVIIGREISYNKDTQEITVNRALYFDDNGKKTATYDELLEYIKDIYYVLLSRGIKGTYLYVCNDELREYMENYIDVVG